MKVTFHAGIVFDGQIDTSITQEVELPDNFLPSDVEAELKSWTKCMTFSSYNIHEDGLPQMPIVPTDETHAVH